MPALVSALQWPQAWWPHRWLPRTPGFISVLAGCSEEWRGGRCSLPWALVPRVGLSFYSPSVLYLRNIEEVKMPAPQNYAPSGTGRQGSALGLPGLLHWVVDRESGRKCVGRRGRLWSPMASWPPRVGAGGAVLTSPAFCSASQIRGSSLSPSIAPGTGSPWAAQVRLPAR